MANEFIWKVIELRTDAQDGVVEVVYGVGPTEEAVMHNLRPISFTPDPSADGFIPYSELTEEVVLQWVKDELGEEFVTRFEQKSIPIEKEEPPKTTPLPWGN
jgi:hypothetical protein